MQPVYGLTAGLTNNTVVKAVRQALDCAGDRQDILPESLARKYSFMPYDEAVRKMHFPGNKGEFAAARERFVFEEFLVFVLSLRRLRDEESWAVNRFVFRDQPRIEKFLEDLPYSLTAAQRKVW